MGLRERRGQGAPELGSCTTSVQADCRFGLREKRELFFCSQFVPPEAFLSSSSRTLNQAMATASMNFLLSWVLLLLLLLCFFFPRFPVLEAQFVSPERRVERFIDTQEPVATPWPWEFTINFTTNNGRATGFLAYDWANEQQLIVHGPGSTSCPTKDSCSFLENSVGGTYSIVPSIKQCVDIIPNVGSVPPDWTVQGVFAGVQESDGVLCYRFTYPPTMHEYLETVTGGIPCVFVFPIPSMTYEFLPSTFSLGSPNPDLFQLPEYCSAEELS